jgi:hypothetical protein
MAAGAMAMASEEVPMEPYEPPSPQRESTLTIMLTGMVCSFILFFVVLITGGWVLWLLLVVALLASFGAFHYLLWGKMLDEQVAGEREEYVLRRRALDEDGES